MLLNILTNAMSVCYNLFVVWLCVFSVDINTSICLVCTNKLYK